MGVPPEELGDDIEKGSLTAPKERILILSFIRRYGKIDDHQKLTIYSQPVKHMHSCKTIGNWLAKQHKLTEASVRDVLHAKQPESEMRVAQAFGVLWEQLPEALLQNRNNLEQFAKSKYPSAYKEYAEWIADPADHCATKIISLRSAESIIMNSLGRGSKVAKDLLAAFKKNAIIAKD